MHLARNLRANFLKVHRLLPRHLRLHMCRRPPSRRRTSTPHRRSAAVAAQLPCPSGARTAGVVEPLAPASIAACRNHRRRPCHSRPRPFYLPPRRAASLPTSHRSRRAPRRLPCSGRAVWAATRAGRQPVTAIGVRRSPPHPSALPPRSTLLLPLGCPTQLSSLMNTHSPHTHTHTHTPRKEPDASFGERLSP